MENLQLTYDEVVHRIPYRNLVVMQRDKLHIASGDVMEEVTEEEFFRVKGKASPLKKSPGT